MDERMPLVARPLAGEAMAELCRGFGIYGRPATRSLIVIRNVGFTGSATEVGAPIATPTIAGLAKEYFGFMTGGERVDAS